MHAANKAVADNVGADGADVKSAIAAVEAAAKGEDTSVIDTKTQALVQAMQALSQAALNAQQSSNSARAESKSDSREHDDNIVDAEVRERRAA